MRNPNLAFVRSLYPKSESTPPRAGKWVGMMVHCLQAPDKPNMARSLAQGWFRNPTNETSVSGIIDSVEAVQTFNFCKKVWGCGTGNDYLVIQTEHVGYAEWTKAQWTTASMKKVIRNSAKYHAWFWYHYAMIDQDIDYYPEWLSLTQIARQSRSGFLTHNDARRVFGGTSHWDPGPNFPYALLRDWTHEELDKLTGRGQAPVRDRDVYTVAKGDTLSGIAYKYDIVGGYQTLAKWNGIKNPDSISIGQKIRLIPPANNAVAKAQAVYDELRDRTNLSDAAVKHIRTAWNRVQMAQTKVVKEAAEARYQQLLRRKVYTPKDDVSHKAFQHVLTALSNLEKAKQAAK